MRREFEATVTPPSPNRPRFLTDRVAALSVEPVGFLTPLEFRKSIVSEERSRDCDHPLFCKCKKKCLYFTRNSFVTLEIHGRSEPFFLDFVSKRSTRAYDILAAAGRPMTGLRACLLIARLTNSTRRYLGDESREGSSRPSIFTPSCRKRRAFGWTRCFFFLYGGRVNLDKCANASTS